VTDLPSVVTRTDEEVVAVTGDDRLSYLDATTTQALKDARPGRATAALVLDANGNPLAMFDVLVLPDRVLLVTPNADVTAVVMTVLAGRTFLADARFALTGLCVARLHGASARDVAVRGLDGVAVVPEPGTVRGTPSGDGVLVGEGSDVAAAITLIAPERELEELTARLRAAGAIRGDGAALDAWRIASGRPTWGREVIAPHLPEEAGLLPTHVHLAKGCYPGQEAVARMWMLGRPRRRFAALAIHHASADAALGASGTALPLLVAGAQVGTAPDVVDVTAVELEQGRALGFVPGRSEIGARFTVSDGVELEVIALPGDDAVPPGHDPAMRRRRDRAAGEAMPPRRAPA
jgi:folate-binding protein YgfZ